MSHHRRSRARLGHIAGAVAVIASLGATAGCGAGAKAPAASSTQPHRGGSLTVLENSSLRNWTSLDPATDTQANGWSYMDAIYGQLFERGAAKNGDPVSIPDLATGYQFLDNNKTVVVDIRPGVEFSDGTPFTAAAVADNWLRDLHTTCSCQATFLQSTPPVIKVLGKYQLSISFTYPDATFIHGLQDSQLNWIGSPTAEQKMSEQAFALNPVGAGPFIVANDSPGTELDLKRNPHYWQKGLPYLNQLSFKLVGSDESAYEALLAGSGQAYEDMVSPQLAPTFGQHFQVISMPSDAIVTVQFNTRVAPFNNIKAREAVAYATDAALLDKKLFNDATPTDQSFIGPGGLFYVSSKVPGTIAYNLAKAKALVKQLGGLSFSLFCQGTPALAEEEVALAAEWKQAGINVTVSADDFAQVLSSYFSLKWQAALHAVGNVDPALSTGPSLMFGPLDKGNFSGVVDPTLNSLFVSGAETVNPAARTRIYSQAQAIITKNVYGQFLWPIYNAQIAVKGVGAPGLTTTLPPTANTPQILWQYAYNNN